MKRKWRVGFKRSCLCVLIALALAVSAGAADNYWQHDPATPGDWFDPNNWSRLGLPTPSDRAYITNGGEAQIAGGDGECRYLYLGCGSGESGTLTHTGGTNTITLKLYLGRDLASAGTYNLSGTGQLSADSEWIGYWGTGTFTQTGGTNLVSDSLYLGRYSGAIGTYELGGTGQLSANYEYVGYEGTGQFTQTDGTNTTAYLSIANSSRYDFTGGTLQVNDGLDLRGTIDFGGSSMTLSFTNALVRLSNNVENAENASLTVGANSLLIIPAGFDPNAVFKSYNNTGMTHTAGTTLVVGAAEGFSGTGQITDHVQCEGTISAASGGFIHLSAGVNVSGGGSVDLGAGRLYVEDMSSSLADSGQLSAYREYVGYSSTGQFTQTGGINMATNYLLLGYGPGSSGTYELSGGELWTGFSVYVGVYGAGQFTQGGGTSIISEDLYLAHNPGSSGTYELGGTAQLSAWSEYIGYYGTGTFTQTGGTNAISDDLRIGYSAGVSGIYIQSGGTNTIAHSLVLGCQAGSIGTYELSGTAQLSADDEFVGGSWFDEGARTGVFTHTGGTNTVSGDLYLARNPDSIGTYDLSGTGQLSAYREYIGGHGTGTFIQTGGTNAVDDHLYVGYYGDGTSLYTQSGGTNTVSSLLLGRYWGSSGTYELGGTGQLSASKEYIGYYGTGGCTFTQTGGTNTVSEFLSLGELSTGVGTYIISAGTLSTRDFYLGREGTGTLNITGASADIAVSKLLHFGPKSTLAAVPGATIHMTGSSFENKSTDATKLAGLENLTLIFEGGDEDIDPFEVAGKDLGAVAAGWTENFVLGTLQLGGVDIGKIQLVNNFDNQPDWVGNEALYVNNLVLNEGAYIDLNGLNLYYLNGGGPKKFFFGDANLDGEVAFADYQTLEANFSKSGTRAQGDFDGDGTVTFADYQIVELHFGNGLGASPAPEPATVAFLGLGLVGVFAARRKRRMRRTKLFIGMIGTLVCVSIAASLAGAAKAQEKTCWEHDPASAGDWFDPDNWSLGVPGSHDAIIENGGTAEISYGVAGASDVKLGGADSGYIVQSGDSIVDWFVTLWVGDRFSDSEGTYVLNGTGSYRGHDTDIGWCGRGEFVQNGATNYCDRINIYANGTYRLNAGAMDVMMVRLYGGEFIQAGGSGESMFLTILDGGAYTLADGTLDLDREWLEIWDGSFIQTGGAITVYQTYLGYELGSEGIYTISGGSLIARYLCVKHYDYGVSEYGESRFNIADAGANITASQLLNFGPNSTFTAVPGATIHMTGSAFENENTDAADLAGLENLTLIFEGGAGDVDPFEVAGEDLGTSIAGWTSNFVLGTLQLGGVDVGKIQLVNNFDNQPDWVGSEALYVNNLVLNEGALIDLNNLNLYYLNGGGPKKLFHGDTNLDGEVSFPDYQRLEAGFGKSGTWAQGDFNGDGMVTFADYQILEIHFGSGLGASPTPEPATAAFLCLGLAVVIASRRNKRK